VVLVLSGKCEVKPFTDGSQTQKYSNSNPVDSGIECMVIASVPTLAGGSMNEMSALKGGRLAQIIHENGLPVINLTQSVSAG
jgi:hypothetical protein